MSTIKALPIRHHIRHLASVEAFHSIRQDVSQHVSDLSGYHEKKTRNTARHVSFYHRTISISRASLYTVYFWFDDFPARLVVKLSHTPLQGAVLVALASFVVGASIAFVRRDHLRKVYRENKTKFKWVGLSISQMMNALVLGAPNTVRETAIDGTAKLRNLMSNGAIAGAAATYALFQSFTAGPVIDKIDSILPGSGFIGNTFATASFVVLAIFGKAYLTVHYSRMRARRDARL